MNALIPCTPFESRPRRLERLAASLGPELFTQTMIAAAFAHGRPEPCDKIYQTLKIDDLGISPRWWKRFSREIGGNPKGRQTNPPQALLANHPARLTIDNAILNAKHGEGGLRTIFESLDVKQTTGLGWPRFQQYASQLRSATREAWSKTVAEPHALVESTDASFAAAQALARALETSEELSPLELAQLARTAVLNTESLARTEKIKQTVLAAGSSPPADPHDPQDFDDTIANSIRKVYGLEWQPQTSPNNSEQTTSPDAPETSPT